MEGERRREGKEGREGGKRRREGKEGREEGKGRREGKVGREGGKGQIRILPRRWRKGWKEKKKRSTWKWVRREEIESSFKYKKKIKNKKIRGKKINEL